MQTSPMYVCALLPTHTNRTELLYSSGRRLHLDCHSKCLCKFPAWGCKVGLGLDVVNPKNLIPVVQDACAPELKEEWVV